MTPPIVEPDRSDAPGGGYDAEVARAAARSLGWNAAYCAGVGAVALLTSDAVAPRLERTPRQVRTVGLASLGWAAWLGHRAYHGTTRRHLQVVTGANLAGAAALVAGAASRRDVSARAWWLGLAGEVGAFAVRQARLLHRSHV